VKPEYFYDPLHARIFEAAARLIRAGRLANPVILKSEFENEPPIGQLTVPQYLGRLAANATSIINVHEYALTVERLWKRRNLIVIGETMKERAYDISEGTDPAPVIEGAERSLYELAAHAGARVVLKLATPLAEVVEASAVAHRTGAPVVGIKTGFAAFDKAVGGLRPGNVLVLAGRPSMGKSTAAVNLAMGAARAGTPTLILSLEMSAVEIARRVLSAECRIDGAKIETGAFGGDEDWRRIHKAASDLDGVPAYICEAGGVSSDDARGIIRRCIRKYGVGFVVIDYLQLMRSPNARGRYEVVTDNSIALKAMATEFKLPIIVLSQMSRESEKRGAGDRRPQLSDLRESGSIEQDADIVLFVHREEYYLQKSEPEDGAENYAAWQRDLARWAGKAELIVAKHRHAPIGKTIVSYDGATYRFYDPEENAA
jgi:replicative DNA helicase